MEGGDNPMVNPKTDRCKQKGALRKAGRCHSVVISGLSADQDTKQNGTPSVFLRVPCLLSWE